MSYTLGGSFGATYSGQWTNQRHQCVRADGDDSQTGERFNVSLTLGTSYRVRLVNRAVDTHFKFSIDNHTITVIAADFMPIKVHTATVLNLGIGRFQSSESYFRRNCTMC
jgi:hypothetical protein